MSTLIIIVVHLRTLVGASRRLFFIFFSYVFRSFTNIFFFLFLFRRGVGGWKRRIITVDNAFLFVVVVYVAGILTTIRGPGKKRTRTPPTACLGCMFDTITNNNRKVLEPFRLVVPVVFCDILYIIYIYVYARI